MSKTYGQPGVNIHTGYETIERVSSHVKRTMRKKIIDGLGGFGTIFSLSQSSMTAPVLVSGTDGVGAELKLATDYDKHDSMGIDAVAMRVNDILATGAEPLYFLDYIATNKVVPEVIEQIVRNISDACVETDTALIGGETAEMGEVYHEDEYDMAGFAVGTVEKDDYVGGSEVKEGQVAIGLVSNGIHSNGYSLVRKLTNESGIDLASSFDNRPFIDVFLEPAKLYVRPILALKKEVSIKAMNHITGEDFYGNILRALPTGYAAKIDTTSFPTPKVFDWLRQQGNIETNEMYNIFNMDIGYTVVVDERGTPRALKILAGQNVETYRVGRIVKSESTAIELLGV